MSIKDNLIKSKIPDFMKSYPELVAYIESMGSFMDDTKTYIEHFKYHADYKNGTDFNIANTLRSEGFELPANSEQIPRIILRDLMHNLVRKGTVDSIVWALRVLGITFEIYQMWLPNPIELQKGFYKHFDTGVETRYNETPNSYKDYLYGETYVDENGLTYFHGSDYVWLGLSPEERDEYVSEGYVVIGYVEGQNDPFQFKGIPIYGEYYPTIQEEENRVSSTPHFLLRITYPATPSDLTQFLIDSLTLDKNRPLNTRLIVEVI
jgi:hypothetical protein